MLSPKVSNRPFDNKELGGRRDTAKPDFCRGGEEANGAIPGHLVRQGLRASRGTQHDYCTGGPRSDMPGCPCSGHLSLPALCPVYAEHWLRKASLEGLVIWLHFSSHPWAAQLERKTLIVYIVVQIAAVFTSLSSSSNCFRSDFSRNSILHVKPSRATGKAQVL